MSDSLFPNSPENSNGLALARKWRPKNFHQLVGQDHVVKALTHALDQQRLHHAWLFTGTRGVGKTTISRILAKSLNCIGQDGQNDKPTSEPCGECSVCREIDAGRFVDYVEMDAASNRGVDEMAALLEKAVYAPSSGRFKVYMIDEVHMLTSHAFNSMLKTLEEPPPHIKFILATTDPQKIPVTVLSRCLQFNLKQMPPSLIVEHLKGTLEKEGVSAEDNALRIIAKSAQGSMRDALSLTDQAIAYSSGSISETAVRAMLGSIDDAYLTRILDGLVNDDGKDLLALASEMGVSSMSFGLALQDLASLLQKIAMEQVIPGSVLDEWTDAESIRRFAKLISKEQVQLYYQIALVSRQDLNLAPDEETGFLMTLLRMLAFRPAESSGGGGGSRSVAPKTPTSTAPPIAKVAASANVPSKSQSTPSLNQAQAQEPRELPSNVEAPLDWQVMIRQLPLRGLVQQFAYQTELKSWQDMGAHVQVDVITSMPQIATEDAVARLRAMIEQQIGKPVKLKVEAGEAQKTVAVAKAQEKQELQEEAQKKIATSPLVKQLESQIGARVIPGSERPI